MKAIRVLVSTALLAGIVAFGALGPADARAAVPSATQIETSMQRGDWSTADRQLTEVLAAHPTNARAHYLYAQVLDREGRSSAALAQIQQARTLDPAVKFTDPARFAAVERRIRARASSSGGNSGVSRAPALAPVGSALGGAAVGGAMNSPAAMQSVQQSATMAPASHAPSSFSWILMLLVICAIGAVLVWTLRRARARGSDPGEVNGAGAGDRHGQMKQATDLLNAVRTLKLDVRLSTRDGHEALLKETENLEAQALSVLDTLSKGQNTIPAHELETLERQLESIQARNDGRPDPAAARAESGQSPFAAEADRFGRGNRPYDLPPQPQQPQPPVIVQQPGGFGGGMGGLLTGVLLGNMLGGSRDRVVERDVLVDDNSRGGNPNDSGVDYGQGDNNWDSGNSDGGGIDVGSDNSSDDWSNS